MGLLTLLPSLDLTWTNTLLSALALLTLTILLNIAKQLLFRNPNEPPLVFHWLPFIGSTITYGMDPYTFFFTNRALHGDVFTFILLGKKTTVCLGTKGNDFILNGKLRDVNAEEIYSPLTTPVFGKDVVYDCPNAKLMEQKKFVKFGLTSSALRSYVQLIGEEVRQFFDKDAASKRFAAESGTLDIPPAMGELTTYTASRSLQGKEVRAKFDSSFADAVHDLDKGFSPINFQLPWAPLPHNRKRDLAQKKMTDTYLGIIQARREEIAAIGREKVDETREEDMIWNLMDCVYKDGVVVPDHEIAHMMIALLMAGQHSSSSTSSWILLRLATRPEIQEELLEEQRQIIGTNPDGSLKDLTYDDLNRLPLHNQVVKETLRLHTPIHSILRAVKSPMTISVPSPRPDVRGDGEVIYTIPTTHILLATPGVTARTSAHFPEPMLWEPHRWDEKPSAEISRLAPSYLRESLVEEKEDYGYGEISKGAASPYLPFGAGRHRCIGEQFAYVQLQTVLATVIRDFRFGEVEGGKGVVGTDYSSLFSQPLRPAVVRWTRRGGKGGKA
ncbi:Lanosterol 14-alpha-demethylase [Elasticomyces elasticus]|nr:Lanosterol 14-alpha-demethylase [Elasticomyces elasticus]KAK3654082.1 Lanosterol 14-alpha-demethylase [Elasticomyces elasticus]KAK4914660.1 Lanosterol 14-alpha-demethylase [Elasticomyces elasticus]KAK5753027.1 Lanosterol 14-alpha-demethylase [Elasticomyces elasticus]